MVEQVNALSLLKEEMSTDEIHLKVNAIHRLKTVIMSIGPQESTAQLIPYLNSLIEDQDDEVLFAIAEELGMCFDIMQDDKTAFLPLLEKLCQKDETVVREQASKSLISICKELDDSVLQNVFCPLIIRLADASWFPGRVSAIPLFFFAYAKANSQKEPLRKKFMELCQEDTPMIRRVCAAKLGEFATKLEKQHVIQELLPVFRQLSQDDQDSCRVLCIESLIPMARYLTKEENRVHTLGSLLNAGEDKSWKVRLCFARNFAQFAEAFGREITDNNLVQTFNQLLDDNEQEVRNAAINSLTLSLKNLGPEKICNILLPTLQSTLANAQIAFKCGMGLALCEMSPIVGKNYTETSVLPILTELLKADNSEVRLNVATNIHKLADVVGEDLLSQTFLQLLNGLVKDPQWRVRMAIFDVIGKLAICFEKKTRDKEESKQALTHLEPIFFQYLTDTAASVRVMGVQKTGEMAAAFGHEWVSEKLIPKAVESYNRDQQGFNYRMCALETISSVMPVLPPPIVAEMVVPTLLNACKDKVPNVQFCCARIIKSNRDRIDSATWESKIVPRLTEMCKEADKDVAYFAAVALQKGSPQ